MTGQEICELIVKAAFLRKPNGEAPTAREIWESSPTGELYQVWEWFEEARLIIGIHDGVLY